VHFPSPLHTPLDQEDHSSSTPFSNVSRYADRVHELTIITFSLLLSCRSYLRTSLARLHVSERVASTAARVLLSFLFQLSSMLEESVTVIRLERLALSRIDVLTDRSGIFGYLWIHTHWIVFTNAVDLSQRFYTHRLHETRDVTLIITRHYVRSLCITDAINKRRYSLPSNGQFNLSGLFK